MYDSKKISKIAAEVEVHMDDGSQFFAVLALGQGQRVSDLMNDDREFLPLQSSGGTVMIVRKAVIAKVVQLDQHIEQENLTDPYDIMGVPRSISDEELQKLYHQLCRENHPDKVQSSGLSPQLADMANARMIRINDAYQRISTMRRAEAANGEDGSSAADPLA